MKQNETEERLKDVEALHASALQQLKENQEYQAKLEAQNAALVAALEKALYEVHNRITRAEAEAALAANKT